MLGRAAASQEQNFSTLNWRACYKSLDTLVVVLSSETDDSSSFPAAEKAEASPGARKPSIHLTLPDFQDASTSMSSVYNNYCHCLFAS